MQKLLIIGSGASGVHFALSVLGKGHDVIMADVGHARPPTEDTDERFADLKTKTDDPVRFFLGERYEGIVHAHTAGEYYGFPPNKRYVFSRPSTFDWDAKGFEPLFSFAQGGLAEAWTGGTYPLNDDELRDFPFRYGDMEPYYNEVASRIGITGAKDDLARFLPFHDNLTEPLRLDRHGALLIREYEKRKASVVAKLRCHVGRSRVAVLSDDKGDRTACAYRGRCLWGCPRRSLYTPVMTLDECRRYANFTYLPDMYVSHFRSRHGRILSAVATSPNGGTPCELSADRFVLAAGTLGSSLIYLRSILKETGETVALPGLMDNRQVLIPFLNMRMIGESYDPDNYQYHQLALGIEGADPAEYVHGQITTLKGALVHPIISGVPMDLRGSIFAFRNVRAGLGVINVNFHDRRREENYVTLESGAQQAVSRLAIRYSPPDGERERIKQAVKVVKRLLWQLGCVVPPGMVHTRPMGASVHYAGTIPMSTGGAPHTASPECRSHYFENLHLVDGTTFPFLPAKNLTFTLMANAVRVAERAF